MTRWIKEVENSIYQSNPYSLKYEHNRYTASYTFRHYFSAIMHHTYIIKRCWGWWMYTFLNTSYPGGTFRDLQSLMERMPFEMSADSERPCICIALTFFFHKRWGQTVTCLKESFNSNHLILCGHCVRGFERRRRGDELRRFCSVLWKE